MRWMCKAKNCKSFPPLPIWGIVGEMKHEKEEEKTGEKEYSIWTHKKFEIGYSKDQIVDIQLTSEHKVKLEEGAKIPFTVEIIWKPSEVKFTDRYEKFRPPVFSA